MGDDVQTSMNGPIMPMAMPFYGHTSEGALQYQLDSAKMVEQVEHVLKGERLVVDNKTGQGQWQKVHTAMLNDDGVCMIMGYMDLYVGGTKNFALTNFDEDYVSEQVMHVGNLLIDNLQDNWTKYDIKDYNTASFIVDVTCACVYSILKKGENANYLKFLRSTQTISEIQSYNNAGNKPTQKDGGLLASLFKKKRTG